MADDFMSKKTKFKIAGLPKAQGLYNPVNEHDACGVGLVLDIKNRPSFSTEKINQLRISLIQEELDELKEAMANNDLLEVADALTDLLYVTYGAGHAFGIDLDKCFNEVQNSNMSKLGEDGKPIYNELGKVMKGPNYFKPDLTKFVNK